MTPQKTSRMLVATAVVSVLAILLVTPAQAYWANEGGGSTPTAVVGNPGDSGWIAEQAPQTVGNPGDGAYVSSGDTTFATSTGSGFDTQTFALIAGGAVLALILCAGALVLSSRHRRVALP